ncbi:GNAT family N-acetyltransferase [Vibrio sp. M260118]|uniref:GNAT family N-acetyltransferase n=1 Tax=Vibrio sp. M260118 TaxID=3020896 RepID=UPI002F3FD07C
MSGEIWCQQVLPTALPMELLLEADPSEESIASYLNGGWGYSAQLGEQLVAVSVVKPISDSTAEIYNVAVNPNYQQKGIGSALLRYVLDDLNRKHIARVELETGTFGYPLTFYHRLGFRVDGVIKDHFLDNYPEPIFETGIQHKDMLRLYIQLG